VWAIFTCGELMMYFVNHSLYLTFQIVD